MGLWYLGRKRYGLARIYSKEVSGQISCRYELVCRARLVHVSENAQKSCDLAVRCGYVKTKVCEESGYKRPSHRNQQAQSQTQPSQLQPSQLQQQQQHTPQSPQSPPLQSPQPPLWLEDAPSQMPQSAAQPSSRGAQAPMPQSMIEAKASSNPTQMDASTSLKQQYQQSQSRQQ